MRRLIYILAILLMSGVWLSSCQTQYIPMETVRVEYKTRDSIRFDSIYQRDSVYLKVKGDTVYKYKYKYLYKYQYLNRVDTVVKIDSVQVPYPVERELSLWQSVKLQVGEIALGVNIGLIIIVVWLIRRKR